LDVVIPCYNEARNLPGLAARLTQVIAAMPDAETSVIFVNDGSADSTLSVLLGGALLPRYRVVDLARNFGKEAAIKAGLTLADGDVVAVMDADLQHPPELLPDMLAHWREGFDVVVGQRRSRDTDSPWRRVATNLFYAVLNRMSERPVANGEGDFRLMSRRVVAALNDLGESNLFLKGVYSFVGFRKALVPFDVAPTAGKPSSFSAFGLIRLAATGLITNSILPLRFSLWLGLLMSFISFLYLCFEVVRFLMRGTASPGYTTLLGIVVLIGGCILVVLGIIGEYVGRIFIETKRRPQFIIAEVREF